MDDDEQSKKQNSKIGRAKVMRLN